MLDEVGGLQIEVLSVVNQNHGPGSGVEFCRQLVRNIALTLRPTEAHEASFTERDVRLVAERTPARHAERGEATRLHRRGHLLEQKRAPGLARGDEANRGSLKQRCLNFSYFAFAHAVLPPLVILPQHNRSVCLHCTAHRHRAQIFSPAPVLA